MMKPVLAKERAFYCDKKILSFYGINSILLLFFFISSLAFCSIARRTSFGSEISFPLMLIFILELG